MIWIFNRDDRLAVIASNENPEALPILTANMHEVLNGDINLDFEVPLDHAAAGRIEEGFSAAVQRTNGAYELFIIDEIQEIKGSEESTLAISCRHAVQELQDEIIEAYAADRKHADIVLPELLNNTRWEAGTIQNTTQHDLTVNKESVLEALQTFIKRWQGEISYSFDIFSDRIRRRINFYQQLGQDAGRRFEFGKDLESLKRTIDSSGIKTALIGVGLTITTDAEGNEIREDLLFTDISSTDPAKPAGQNYIEDPEAREKWGFIMPDGSRRNRMAFYENKDIEDPEVLLQETWDLLQAIKKPKISYEVEVLDLAKIEGKDYREVNLGDTARIIDDDLTIEIAARALEIKHDLITPERTKILLDNFQEVLTAADQLEDPSQRIDELERTLGEKIDRGEIIPKQWLEDEVRLLTERIRAGGGTVTINDDQGILIEEDPINKTGGALKLIGGMLALANTYDAAQADYNWRSFGTGDSFLADLINTGFIKFDRAQGGTLTLGGEDNQNGVMIVRNTIGEDIAQLSGDYGGFGKLRIDELANTQNIVFKTFAGSENVSSNGYQIVYYVAANDGSDSNSGTSDYPLATVTEALRRLPKFLEHDVYIYIAPAYLQDSEIVIEGFQGQGKIELRIWRLTVRYIRDWLNGSSANPANHWVEVKGLTEGGTRIHANGDPANIIHNATNVNETYLGRVSDNQADDTTLYWDAGNNNGVPSYVDAYTRGGYTDVESLYVWHYYNDGRSYFGTKTQVSADRSRYFTVFDSAREGRYNESAAGKRIFMNKAYLKGRLLVKQTTARVYIYDLFIDGSEYGSYATYIYSALSFYMQKCVVFGNTNVSYAIYVNGSPAARFNDCEINTASYAGIISAYGSLTQVHNCVGSGFPYGHYAYANASIAGGGTGLLGSTAHTRTAWGGQVDGSWTATSGEFSPITIVEKTETWTSTDSHSWDERVNNWKADDKDVLQGKWDIYGLYRGCWFFGSGMRNTVNGTTIKKIRVYVTRSNSSGSSSAVPIFLMPHGYDVKPPYAPSLFTSNVVTVNLTRGQSAWVDCTDKFKSLFQNGSAYGISIYTSSTNNSYYARCTTSCKVEITYEKQV